MMKPEDDNFNGGYSGEYSKGPPKASSALSKRPAPKLINDSEGPSYVLPGIQLTDPLLHNKKVYNGWQQDPEALLVVEGLTQGQVFSGSDFSGVDFSGATLSFIDLSGADLTQANLAGVDLRGADLSGADLRGVNLEGANLEGANLEGALLDGAYLKDAVIAGVKLSKKALNILERMQQLQREAEEGKLDLRRVPLKYLDLRRLDLKGVDLTGIDLSGVNLVGVNLTGAKIDQMYLDGTHAFKQMRGRTLDIKKGNLAGADLTTVNMVRARQEELDILREKRLEARAIEEQMHLEQMNLRERESLKRQEQEVSLQTFSKDDLFNEASSGKSEKIMSAEKQLYEKKDLFAEGKETASSLKTFDAELELLKSRRQQQPTQEEMYAQVEDVVLENDKTKSKAKSTVTKRPRRKEYLPPSKYDFPILYKDPEDENAKPSKTVAAVKEVAKVAEQVTFHVKKAIRKMIPRRSRTRRQRQRS